MTQAGSALIVTVFLLWGQCSAVGHTGLLCTHLVNLQLFKRKRKKKAVLIDGSELGMGLSSYTLTVREKLETQLIMFVLLLWVLLLKGVAFL